MLSHDKNKNGSGVIIDTKRGEDILDVVVGVDAGSTQTRVYIADKVDTAWFMRNSMSEDILRHLREDFYVIPSTFATVSDEREIQPRSDNLEDNYDSHIIRVKTSAVKPIVGRERIVRGRKILDAAGLVEMNLDSSTNKMDNSIFYLNVLDGIGYGLIQRYDGNIPRTVNVYLVLSVRPKEMSMPCQEKMNDNFIGEFIFQWGGIDINLHIKKTLYTTEPEAQMSGTSAISAVSAELGNDSELAGLSQKLDQCELYMHIEGGGSSIGVEVMRDGKIMDACSSTFSVGGNYLTRVLMGRLREVKGRMISEDAARSALITCLLRNGREREDVTEIVAAAKRQVALDILERVRHNVIDLMSDCVLTDFELVTLGGRLFKEDEQGNSIGVAFAELLAQASPYTEVVILKDNYIPQGNMIIGINEFPEFAELGAVEGAEE